MTVLVHSHWSVFPMDQWDWPNFSPKEMACRRTGKLTIDTRSMDMLQELRNRLGRPLIINSAYRSPEHNATLPGASKNSYHLKAMAFDISMANHDPHEFIREAAAVGFKGIGTYPKDNFVHIDTRTSVARWGKDFPEDMATELPMESHKTPSATEDKGVQGAVSIGAAQAAREAAPLLRDGGDFLEGLHPVAQVASVALLAIGLYLLYRKVREIL